MSAFLVYIIIIIAVIVTAKGKGKILKDRQYHKPKPKVSAKPNVARDKVFLNTENNAVKPNVGKDIIMPNVPTGYGDETPYQSPPQTNQNKIFKPAYEGGEPKLLGGRFVDSDRVPQNHHVIPCKNCGAENVVPCYSDNYHCYFCWEKL